MAPRPLLLLVVLLGFSGCVQPAGDAEGPQGPERFVPPEPEPAPPEVLHLWNGTLEATAPGGAGDASFEVPASGYVELSLNATGAVRIVGEVSVVLVAPDGSETVYVDGAFVQDDEAGVAAPGASRGDWRQRVPVQGGAWTLRWSVDGEMRLPLLVKAL